MGKKKIKKKLKKLESRIRSIEKKETNIRSIGFEYLSNHHDENEYDDEGY